MDLKNNAIGQVYTPDYVADFMVQNIKNHYLSLHDNIDQVEVLEPSTGKGVFLKSLLNRGFNNITAYELDPNLNKILLENYPNVKFNFTNFLGADPNDKFDIIIGNPPYLGQNYNAHIFQDLIDDYPICRKYFVGNMDLFYYFIHYGILKLKPGGLLSYITTNYWLTKSNKTGIKFLKPHIANDCYILQYIDLSRLKIFSDALGQHNCIFILQKKDILENENHINKPIQVIQVKKKGKYSDHQSNKLILSKMLENQDVDFIKKYSSGLTNNDLSLHSNWNLLYPNDVKEIIMQIESFCIKNKNLNLLGDYFSIRNGLILIKDEIFILKENEQIIFDEDDILIKINDKFTKLNPLEKKRLKKIYKSRAIKPYGYLLEEQEGYLLFFNKSDFRQLEIGERNIQISKIYPNLSKYLKQYEQELKEALKNANENRFDFFFPRRGSHIKQNRDKGLVNLEPLYDKYPKIFFKFISQDNVFGFTMDQYYATSDTYFLWAKKPTEFTSLFLLAYLNSKIVKFIFKSKGLAMKRSKTKIEKEIPLPLYDKFKSKEKNSIIELIQILTRWLVYSANPISDRGPYDFRDEIESTSHLNNLEKEPFKDMIIKAINDKREEEIQAIIDILFYQLFDLDGKEIDYLMREYYYD
ncbi:MAG: Eco57I restriction-modification methylase domain-containing protein [Promethearchaeota archaeon]